MPEVKSFLNSLVSASWLVEELYTLNHVTSFIVEHSFLVLERVASDYDRLSASHVALSVNDAPGNILAMPPTTPKCNHWSVVIVAAWPVTRDLHPFDSNFFSI